MYSYNYVFFNTYDNKYLITRNGYNTICVKELESSNSIRVISYPLDKKPFIIRLFFTFHNSARIEKIINLPFKRLWYPYYFKNDFIEKKPLCFILLNHYISIDYLYYLKREYTDCKIVLLHRDLLKVCMRSNPKLSMNSLIDLEMTFDKGESEIYGFPYFSEYESKIDIPEKFPLESDVFFAGKVKDRLSQLIKLYQLFTNEGLKCFFILVGVPKDKQVKYPGIIYTSRFISYREMLCHTVNTKCVLELNQNGSIGYTSRFLESIIYGKKLISNNQYIKKSIFYSSKNILIFNDISDIDINFIKNGHDFVNYNYNGEFSPFRLIDRIEEELKNLNGE